MARQEKVLAARKQPGRTRDDESLLLSSAESLGRMIGSLQRQIDGASKRLADAANDAVNAIPSVPQSARRPRTRATKRTASRKGAARTASRRKAATRPGASTRASAKKR